MSKAVENIHPEFSRQLSREDKESLLQQRGQVVWLIGLSGSGKSTIANALEKELHADGKFVTMVDGDNLRTGINAGLGFTDEDRNENIRRAAEVAKLLLNNGAIVLVTLITPKETFREMVREILPADSYTEVYVKASFETCLQRDVKGLYAKQAKGEIKNFTGKTSGFEEPINADIVLNTETDELNTCVAKLKNFINL